MSDEKELKKEELDNVDGGWTWPSMNDEFVIERDSKGRAIRWKKDGKAYHYECPNCGGYLHMGTLSKLYCDPCDESWFNASDYKVFD